MFLKLGIWNLFLSLKKLKAPRRQHESERVSTSTTAAASLLSAIWPIAKVVLIGLRICLLLFFAQFTVFHTITYIFFYKYGPYCLLLQKMITQIWHHISFSSITKIPLSSAAVTAACIIIIFIHFEITIVGSVIITSRTAPTGWMGIGWVCNKCWHHVY